MSTDLRVLHGAPSPEELAALVAVLLRRAAGADPDADPDGEREVVASPLADPPLPLPRSWDA